MCHLADHAPDRVAQQPRIGIQRHDEPDPGGQGWRARIGHEGGIRRPPQQAVQLCQLAALALPSHPAPLHGVPQPAAVQQQKTVAPVGWIGSIQPGDSGLGSLDQRSVGVSLFGRGIRPVGQQRIMHGAARAGQMVHLQPFQLARQIFGICQNDRHCDQCAAVVRHAMRQVQCRQRRWPERACHRKIDQRCSRLGRSQRAQNGKPGGPSAAHPRPGQRQPQHQAG